MSFIKAFLIASSILLPTTCFAKFNLKKILFLPAPHYPSDAVVKEVVKKPPFITASNQADMLYMLDYAVRAQEKQERRSDPVIAWMHRHTLKCIIGASSEDRKMLCPNRQERNQFFYISFNMIVDSLESSATRPANEIRIKFLISQIKNLRDEIIRTHIFHTKLKVDFLHRTEKIISQISKYGLQKSIIKEIKTYLKVSESLFLYLLKEGKLIKFHTIWFLHDTNLEGVSEKIMRKIKHHHSCFLVHGKIRSLPTLIQGAITTKKSKKQTLVIPVSRDTERSPDEMYVYVGIKEDHIRDIVDQINKLTTES